MNLPRSLVVVGLCPFLTALAVPVGWNGHYYELVNTPNISWDAAQSAAAAATYAGLPGHLVTSTSQAENEFIATLIDGVISYPSDPSAESALEAWIGGHQVPAGETDPAAGWTWVNGEGSISAVNSTSPYANWFGGEPNDWLGTATEQHLGMWGSDGYGNTIGSWNDEGGLWNISGYLVEYEPAGVPDSGATALLLSGAVLGFGWLRFRKG